MTSVSCPVHNSTNQKQQVISTLRPYSLNEDNRHERGKVERTQGQTMQWQQESRLSGGEDGDCTAASLAEGEDKGH